MTVDVNSVPQVPHPLPRGGGNRITISRFAGSIKRLDERKAMVKRMSLDVEALDCTGLTAVLGEKGLIDSLREDLTEADTLVAQLAAGDGSTARVCVQRLEAVLNGPEWSLAQEVATELEGRRTDIEQHARAIEEEYWTLRRNFDRLSRAVRRAESVRLNRPVPRALASEVEGKFRATEPDLKIGRLDNVAVAVRHAKSLLVDMQLATKDGDGLITVDEAKLDEFTREFENDIETAAIRDGELARRSELFVISGDVTDKSVLPLKVLLRRPGDGDIQETNLYDDVEVLEMDQELFRDTIDRIAEAALVGIRSAGRPAVSADPGGDPAATARLEVGDETRRARPAPAATSALLDQLDPTARLEKVGRRMYSLLIPDAMQRLIDETKCCALTVTSNNPELPWELLHDGDDFLCLKRTFARMPAGQTFPRRTRDTARLTEKERPNVLLIHSEAGEPLPKARTEIEAIVACLEAMEPKPIITLLTGSEVTCSRLTDELSLGNYDVIHYAGHAGFDKVNPHLSYLLLWEEQQFRAGRVQRLLEGHPVVFLNACESASAALQVPGRPTGGTVAQAQGLGSAFVYGGAQACVGSLWPVFDDTAAALAVTFYENLVGKRQRVGEALREARRHSHDAKNDAITWAAYALYGDPAYRLGAPTITTWGSPR